MQKAKDKLLRFIWTHEIDYKSEVFFNNSAMLLSSNLMVVLQSSYLSVLVQTNASLGTEVIAVLSQITPLRVRDRKISLAAVVKLPVSSLWVKKKRSPSLTLSNCRSRNMNAYNFDLLRKKLIHHYKMAYYLLFISMKTLPLNPPL